MDPKKLDFLDALLHPMLTIDSDGVITYCNKACNPIRELYALDQTHGNFTQWLDSKSCIEFSKVWKGLCSDRATGSVFPIRFKGQEKHTQPYRIVTSILDNGFGYTVHIEKTDDIEITKKFSDVLTQHTYDLNWMFHGDQLMYLSPSVRDFLGYTEDEITSLDQWHDLIHVDDLKGYLGQMQKDITAGLDQSLFSYRQRHKDGLYRWFETKMCREFRKDGTVVSRATSVDITQRKKAEMELESHQVFIEALFDADPNMVYVKDRNGTMIYCNESVARFLGRPREDILSANDNCFPTSQQQEVDCLAMERKVIELEEEVIIEEQMSDGEGLSHYFQTVKKPLKIEGGDVHLLSISTNIDKIRYYEKENLKTLKAREDFFAAMSHEIRTPLNAVIGMADILVKRNPRKDQKKLLQTLNFSAKNLMGLINNILDFSKIEAGKIEVEHINFDLRELLANIKLSLKSWSLNKGIDLQLVLSDDLPEIVNGDSVKIIQILNNLTSNAIKFTEEGTVEISARLLSSSDDQYNIEFSVRDTGVGIPPEIQPTIFDPFHQASKSTSRKFGGTGLGLSIVKNLVNLMGGSIALESEPGKGSCFAVELTLSMPDDLPVHRLPISQVRNISWQIRLNILYVEDVSTNQYLIEEMLSDWGINVDMASDGYEALEKIIDCTYDLLLMDIQMPGIDGFETARRIRALEGNYFKEVPIIAMTASTSESTRHEIFKSGMQDIIQKPVNIDELRARIIEYSSVEEEVPNVPTPDEETNKASISFGRTDHLFLSNRLRYQEFLRMAIEEFTINLDLLKQTIKNGDLISFRPINHRMKNLLHTFGMEDLLEHLEEIKERLGDKELKLKEKRELSKSLTIHVEGLIDTMGHKLASLKWQ